MAQLKCIVVTPEETALEVEASFVVVPLFDGELGIAPGHSPMIGRLGFGELRVTSSGPNPSRYYVDGGFVQVDNNTVTVLTGRAVEAEQLDASAARDHLKSASKRPANSDELVEIRDRIVDQARAQIRIAEKAK